MAAKKQRDRVYCGRLGCLAIPGGTGYDFIFGKSKITSGFLKGRSFGWSE
jgi:hypothetical protein